MNPGIDSLISRVWITIGTQDFTPWRGLFQDFSLAGMVVVVWDHLL